MSSENAKTATILNGQNGHHGCNVNLVNLTTAALVEKSIQMPRTIRMKELSALIP